MKNSREDGSSHQPETTGVPPRVSSPEYEGGRPPTWGRRDLGRVLTALATGYGAAQFLPHLPFSSHNEPMPTPPTNHQEVVYRDGVIPTPIGGARIDGWRVRFNAEEVKRNTSGDGTSLHEMLLFSLGMTDYPLFQIDNAVTVVQRSQAGLTSSFWVSEVGDSSNRELVLLALPRPNDTSAILYYAKSNGREEETKSFRIAFSSPFEPVREQGQARVLFEKPLSSDSQDSLMRLVSDMGVFLTGATIFVTELPSPSSSIRQYRDLNMVLDPALFANQEAQTLALYRLCEHFLRASFSRINPMFTSSRIQEAFIRVANANTALVEQISGSEMNNLSGTELDRIYKAPAYDLFNYPFSDQDPMIGEGNFFIKILPRLGVKMRYFPTDFLEQLQSLPEDERLPAGQLALECLNFLGTLNLQLEMLIPELSKIRQDLAK